MSKISIEVSPEAAEVYQSASPEEQERVRVLVDLLIRKPVNSDIDFLRKLMDEISVRQSPKYRQAFNVRIYFVRIDHCFQSSQIR